MKQLNFFIKEDYLDYENRIKSIENSKKDEIIKIIKSNIEISDKVLSKIIEKIEKKEDFDYSTFFILFLSTEKTKKFFDVLKENFLITKKTVRQKYRFV